MGIINKNPSFSQVGLVLLAVHREWVRRERRLSRLLSMLRLVLRGWYRMRLERRGLVFRSHCWHPGS